MTLAEFDALYANRHQTEALEACAAILREVPDAFEWEWRAARLEQFLAMRFVDEADSGAAREHFGRGRELGMRAVKREWTRVEGVFWENVCALEAARLGNPLGAMATLKRAQKGIERAVAIDEAYHFAGPLRVLGRLTQLKPLVLGGNLDNALAFYTRALQIAPGNSTTLLYRADALLHDHQPAEARRTLGRVLEVSGQEWEWETARDKRVAREWLRTRLD